MNIQDMFEFVFKKLYQQNRRSVDSNTSCSYRGFDGARCAVGWLIPDEIYSPEMEGYKISGIVGKYSLTDNIYGLPSEITQNLNFLASLQGAHDWKIIDYENFREGLCKTFKSVGIEYKLNTDFIDTYGEDKL